MKDFKFQLHKYNLELLLSYVKEDPIIKRLTTAQQSGPVLAKGKYETGRYEVTFSRNDVLILLDELSNLLIEKGLNEDDEPNSLGIKIESLIDIFSIVYEEI